MQTTSSSSQARRERKAAFRNAVLAKNGSAPAAGAGHGGHSSGGAPCLCCSALPHSPAPSAALHHRDPFSKEQIPLVFGGGIEKGVQFTPGSHPLLCECKPGKPAGSHTRLSASTQQWKWQFTLGIPPHPQLQLCGQDVMAFARCMVKQMEGVEAATVCSSPTEASERAHSFQTE